MTFLKAAEACAKAGYAFGMGLGSTGDFHQQHRLHVRRLRRRSGQRQG